MDETPKICNFIDYEQDTLDKWIQDYISDEDPFEKFDEFFSTYGECEWIQCESVLRLTQSFINLLTETNSQIDLLKYKRLFDKFFTYQSNRSNTEFATQLLDMINPFVNPVLDSFELDQVKHRNICLVLLYVLEKFGNHADFRVQIFEYLTRKINSNELLETVSLSLICLETIYETNLHDEKQKLYDNLKQFLLDIEDQDQDHHVIIRKQVLFQVQWFIDQVINRSTAHAHVLKYLPDRLYVRNDCNQQIHPTRASHQLFSGVHYYEVTLQTNGPMRIGWSTRDSQFSMRVQIGDDSSSIGFDGSQSVIWNDSSKDVEITTKWKSGDIVGCLIDFIKRKFLFYLNGELIKHRTNLHFSQESYYASASIGPYQQIEFNFGQTEFKFMPQEFKSYQEPYQQPIKLQETCLAGDSYWFKPVDLIPGLIDQYFDNEIQIEYDQLLIGLANEHSSMAHHHSRSFDRLEFKTLVKKQGWIRLVHSINKEVDNWGADKARNKLYMIDKLMRHFLTWIEPDLTLSNASKFLELIYQFIESYLKFESTKKKPLIQCTICLMLYFWLIAQRFEDDQQQLTNLLSLEVLKFLKQAISESEELWSVLIALVCVQSFAEADETNLAKFQSDEQLEKDLKSFTQFSSFTTFQDFHEPNFESLNYQIGFTAQWCLVHIFSSSASKSSLNASLRTKFSPNFLCVRNNTDSMLPVRSIFAVSGSNSLIGHLSKKRGKSLWISTWSVRGDNFDSLASRSYHSLSNASSTIASEILSEKSAQIYFYEVILLTSGPIRVGWTTRESSNSNSKSLGLDQFSIGFDLYNRSIWHRGQRVKVKRSSLYPLSSNELANEGISTLNVIGCSIDLANGQFDFYFNGRLLTYQMDVYFDPSEPYFPSVSLPPHQHVYFNFGQEPFKLPNVEVNDVPIDRKFSITSQESERNFTLDYQSIHEAAEQIPERYQLLETYSINDKHNSNFYWFKENLENLSSCTQQLFFQNDLQYEMNEMIQRIQHYLLRDDFHLKNQQKITQKFCKLIRKHSEDEGHQPYHRFVQALIVELNSYAPTDKRISIIWTFVEDLAYVQFDKNVDKEFDHQEEELSTTDTKPNSSYIFENLINKHKLIEILHFYIVPILPPHGQQNISKDLSISMILSILGQIKENILTHEILLFLSRILSTDGLDWSVLMTIIAVENYAQQSTRNLELINSEESLMQKLSKLSNKFIDQERSSADKEDLTFKSFYKISALAYQIEFCANWTIENVFQNGSQDLSTYQSTRYFNINFCSDNLKLSPDKLSVRCDCFSGSIRYELPVTSGIYFYEAILLTKGPMRIGWSTKMSNLLSSNNQIGCDDHSIGFDAQLRSIYHNGCRIKTAHASSSLFSSKSTDFLHSSPFCDVVGCLFDSNRTQFVFYLNGQQIVPRKRPFFGENVYFFSQPYFPAASVSSHQQVYFNFGQEPFKFAPKGVDFRDFHSPISNVGGPMCRLCKKQLHTLQFSSCDHWKLCLSCAIKLARCPTCDS